MFQPRADEPACPVLVVSYGNADAVDCAGARLWFCFSFKQGLEGPAAFLMTEGSSEHLHELTELLTMSPLPTGSEYGPFHYEGLEAVIHWGTIRHLDAKLARNRELERVFSKLTPTGFTQN